MNRRRVETAWRLNLARQYSAAWRLVAPLPDAPRPYLEVRARTAAWAGEVAAAATLLPQWLALTPNDEVAWMLLADVHRRRGDVAAQLAALHRLADLRPSDPATRREIAGLVDAAGDPAAALAAYHEVLRLSPTDAEALRGIAQLHERAGRMADAVAAYEALARATHELAADAQLQFARVLRWSGQADAAALAYDRWWSIELNASVRQDAEAEYGTALVARGRYEEGLGHVESALDRTAGEDALHAAATASVALRDPARAVRYLTRLADRRPLSTDERRWLAGQLEATGDRERALRVLRAILDDTSSDTVSWQRVGDLEAARGHARAALEAYRKVDAGCANLPLLLTLGRAAVAAAQAEFAASTLDALLACAPTDPAYVLDAARLAAGAGEFVAALRLYDQYGRLAEPERGLALEAAQAALGAGRFDAALHWANTGTFTAPSSAQLELVRAQALHLSGKPADAAQVLRRLDRDQPGQPGVAEWRARVSVAQGQQLRAYDLFSRALEEAATPPATLWLARAEAAVARGDLRRAIADYAHAHRAATGRAETLAVDRGRDMLRQSMRPALAAPVEVLTDSNGVTLTDIGGLLRVPLPIGGRLGLRWTTGQVAQHSTVLARRNIGVQIEDVFPTPSVRLDGHLGAERVRDATTPVWRVRATREWPTGGSATLSAIRETPWSGSPHHEPQRYNRVTNLAAVDPTFASTGVRAHAQVPAGERQAVQMESGVRRYTDGNTQHDLYLQYQRELSTGRDGAPWVAVQPYAYVERSDDRRAAYYSPSHHVTLGVAVRAAARIQDWSLEGNLAPQMLLSEGRRGAGAFVSTAVSRQIHQLSVKAEAMIFEDRRSR